MMQGHSAHIAGVKIHSNCCKNICRVLQVCELSPAASAVITSAGSQHDRNSCHPVNHSGLSGLKAGVYDRMSSVTISILVQTT